MKHFFFKTLLFLSSLWGLLYATTLSSSSSMQPTTRLDPNPMEIYQNIKKTLSTKQPGYGRSDYGNLDIVNIPKAYAMFLSAELMQYKRLGSTYDLAMALKAGYWLLDHSDLNQNGIVGWGVPVAWDAFGDGSVNEVNTEYTIATGIVINALMNWLEYAPETAPKSRILQTIRKAISPYLKDSIYSSSGLYNYSLKRSDRKYNCFNAAIYMAGQMQRYTRFISNESLKNKIRLSVDKVMSAALRYKRIDPHGGWYWPYFLEEPDIPNDLAHACYTAEGILTYIHSDGTLKKLFDKKAILKHLDYFSNTQGDEFYFKPLFYSKMHNEKPIYPRTYGLGMILHLWSRYTNNTERTRHLVRFLSKYKISNGLYSRWPNENVSITEYQTYVLYGLASYELQRFDVPYTIYLHSDKEHNDTIQTLYTTAQLCREMKIPMTNFGDGNVSLVFNTKTFKNAIHWYGKTIPLDAYQAVPLKVLQNKKYVFIILRELLTNHLIIAKIDKNTLTLSYDNIDNQKNTFYDFREAIINDNTLLIVVYESTKLHNTLLSYAIDKKLKKIDESTLPSVEDPAGHTYEVIPKIDMLKTSNGQKVYMIGGRLFAEYHNGKLTKKQVPNNVKVFLENVIDNKNEVYTIYMDKSNRYHVYNLTKQKDIYTAKSGEVLWHLAYVKNKLRYRKLISENDLRELFIFDFLNNKASGALYLGTNNIEGWSAWAQIYYLNGMLSFLELAKNDIGFYDTFKQYIPDIKRRLDLEIMLLAYQMTSKEGLRCRIFSVDRSLATFAVQSSRFAMLLHRYLKLFPNQKLEIEYKKLQQRALSLKDHMEVLKRGTSKVVSAQWNRFNEYYLQWPKGNAFYFDGLPVPYNHQNEWATFILETSHSNRYVNIGKSIIRLFLENVTTGTNTLPKNAVWPYWWAKAWEGWTKDEQISEHHKDYIGDKGNGWISFRSIDALSVLSLAQKEPRRNYYRYVIDISRFVRDGKLYPFVSTKLLQSHMLPLIKKKVIAQYIRFTSPWEFDNCVWSYFNFMKRTQME